MQTVLRSIKQPGIEASCKALRCRSTLSPEQVERVLETEVRFPLWQYLQDLKHDTQQELKNLGAALQKTATQKDIHALKTDLDEVKTDLARQPYKLFGAVAAACGAVAAAGKVVDTVSYKVQLTPKE